MFQALDNRDSAKQSERSEWIGLLARAPVEFLEAALSSEPAGETRWLRSPETGLMMVEARVGGGGARFNVGEVTVTRCALKFKNLTDNGETLVGVSYVLGRSHRKAKLAALADALLQDPVHAPDVSKALLEPLRRLLESQTQAKHAKVQQSKVEFFTVAREAGSLAALAEEEQ